MTAISQHEKTFLTAALAMFRLANQGTNPGAQVLVVAVLKAATSEGVTTEDVRRFCDLADAEAEHCFEEWKRRTDAAGFN